MSESENFLSRWSRLKRESGSEESGIDEKQTADALPDAEIPSSAAFDPASLPPIESIVADSDIRQFLQAQVPEELTRAALLRVLWLYDGLESDQGHPPINVNGRCVTCLPPKTSRAAPMPNFPA